MLKNSEGIVLQTIKYGDNGRIVKIYTESNGLLSFIVQGFASKKTFKKIHFQSLNILKLDYYYKNSNNLHRIKESKLVCGSNSEGDIKKTSINLFVNELLQNSIKEEEKNDELYSFIRSKISDFHRSVEVNYNFHLNFSMELTKYLGFFPNQDISEGKYFYLRDGVFGPKSSRNDVLSLELSNLLLNLVAYNIQPTNEERRRLVTVLVDYYQYHIENFKEIKSRAVLEEILA